MQVCVQLLIAACFFHHQVTAYDRLVYSPLASCLSPVVAHVPREVEIGRRRVTIFTANGITLGRTALVVPVALCLKWVTSQLWQSVIWSLPQGKINTVQCTGKMLDGKDGWFFTSLNYTTSCLEPIESCSAHNRRSPFAILYNTVGMSSGLVWKNL